MTVQRLPLTAAVTLVMAAACACDSVSNPTRTTAQNPNDTSARQQGTSERNRSRADELILEGAINDLCYRQTVVRGMTRIRCYANVSAKDIVVYLYPTEDTSSSLEQYEVRRYSQELPADIRREFLDFPDWQWARGYSITVVDRTTR